MVQACFPARSSLWENAASSLLQPLPSWFKKQQVGEETWAVVGETVPSLMNEAPCCPSKPTPQGYEWGVDALLPSHPTPLTGLELCSVALPTTGSCCRQRNDLHFLQQKLGGPGRPLLSPRTQGWWWLAVTRAGTPGVGDTSSPALYPHGRNSQCGFSRSFSKSQLF